MDWKRFDGVRHNVGPVHLDLVESYAQGRISRRQFVRRGAVIGLSVPMISAVIAACGDDDASSPTGGAGTPGTGSAPGTTPGTASGSTTAPGTGPATTLVGGTPGGIITVGAQIPGALDPIAMQDLGAYGLIAQCFEFLATLGDDGRIAPGLAESWEPNEDGSVWTFQLRQGVKWQDGSDFSSADVAATMDRLVAAANAGLAGVIEEGAVDATDPNVAVFNLAAPNGNFPALVSVFNAQTPITPAAFESGMTLDGAPNGTGPWKLDRFDAATGCTFVRNDAWWGGQVPLDGTEFQFFDDLGTMLTAMQGGSVDALIQFSVIGGDALLSSPDFKVLDIQTATHRQVWMRTDEGQFADKRVRQALALTFDRDQMLETLFRGRGNIGNDHPIAPFFPYFDESVPQRTKNIDMAKQLLTDAGIDGLSAALQIPNLQEIPELAQLIVAGAAEAGINLQIAQESTQTFYGSQWCPGEPADPPCSGAAELGIVDYGDRPTPDIYLNAALKTNGIWNSSQYSNPDLDAAFSEFQSSVDVEGQKAACKTMETILNDEVPVGLPFFYNFLSGHSTEIQGVRITGLGQMFLDKASRV
ncbi:MAG: ABC transporter substrate-binding protein [Acidimicrobiia bacterium]|nr:ABC transporter substrate-binding protein [Acidimicrobiia bacterium]